MIIKKIVLLLVIAFLLVLIVRARKKEKAKGQGNGDEQKVRIHPHNDAIVLSFICVLFGYLCGGFFEKYGAFYFHSFVDANKALSTIVNIVYTASPILLIVAFVGKRNKRLKVALAYIVRALPVLALYFITMKHTPLLGKIGMLLEVVLLVLIALCYYANKKSIVKLLSFLLLVATIVIFGLIVISDAKMAYGALGFKVFLKAISLIFPPVIFAIATINI